MLVKPRKEKAEDTPKKTEKKARQSKKQCVCSRCHAMQSYKEITVPIKYGFNCKKSVLIDGIERVCSVCGWHVDDIETCKINRELAEKCLEVTE